MVGLKVSDMLLLPPDLVGKGIGDLPERCQLTDSLTRGNAQVLQPVGGIHALLDQLVAAERARS